MTTCASRARSHHVGKGRLVIGIRRPETQVDDAGALIDRPAERRHQRVPCRSQFAIEHFDREDLGVGRLLANHRGHGGAVAQPIDVVGVVLAARVDAHAAGDACTCGWAACTPLSITAMRTPRPVAGSCASCSRPEG